MWMAETNTTFQYKIKRFKEKNFHKVERGGIFIVDQVKVKVLKKQNKTKIETRGQEGKW